MEKLVRDRIPDVMAAAGIVAAVRVAAPDERLELLTRKLSEEASELAAAPCVEECADVFEVLLAIAAELGASFGDVEQYAAAKRAERGGFDAGLVLTVR